MLDALGGFAIAVLYEEADRIELIRGMLRVNSDVFRDFQKLGTLHNTLGAQGEFKGLAARAALFTRHVGNRRCEEALSYNGLEAASSQGAAGRCGQAGRTCSW